MLTLVLVSTLITIAFGHEMRIHNNCGHAINVGIRGDNSKQEGFNLGSKEIKSVEVPHGWTSGRIWATHGGVTGNMDVTLAEFGLDKDQGNDFYDISLVDAFNLPMKIMPIAGTFKTSPSGNPKYDCKAPICNHNILSDCPNELKEVKNGKVVSCLSACTKFRTQEYCCPNGSPFGNAKACKASTFAHHFKQRCPDAYSYAFDDEKSTFVCRSAAGKASGYITTFCPE